MKLRDLCIFPAFVSFASVACAASVTISVTSADGRPLPGAVVALSEPETELPAVRGPYVMAQKNIAFAPHLLIVPVGAVVDFPNFDLVRHHVYSFSTPKKFEIKLYGRDETKSVRFEKPGVVAIGCNIHDTMSAFIYVTATPYTAITDRSGRVILDVPPARQATLTVWHQSIRAPGNSRGRTLAIPPSGAVTTISTSR